MGEEKILAVEEEKILAVEEEIAPGATEDQTADTGEHLPEGAYDFKTLSRGDILEGKVVRVSPEEILVDVGRKYEGAISSRELESMGPAAVEEIQVGDEMLTYVVNPEDKNGRLVLSLRQADQEKEWRSLEKLFETEEVFEGTVTGHNKGGLIIQLGQVRGFVPSSQLVPPSRWDEDRELTREERQAKMVGRQLMLKIIELDRERNRLILSERAANRTQRKDQKQQLLATLKAGDTCRGRVSSLCDFGAFVDLGGADGLIHLSELSWGRISHSREVLNLGDEVEVYILNINQEKRRIGLSLKRLQSDPWSQAEEKYSEGQLVEGTITKLTEFGAFARLKGDDIEGLIHVSELSNDRIAHPKEVIKEGETLTLRIIRLDLHRRRMGLSLKSVAKAEYADQDWRVEQAAMLKEKELEAEAESAGEKKKKDEEEELTQAESEGAEEAPAAIPVAEALQPTESL
ncbi:MAG: S1 RNA-binding domain-containing protein [Anaerolineales bacterium]|nr:S1 RNA-binding domain-containing protein [Anaerolineales bacterium]